MFWTEKFMILIMYAQRLALLLLWDLSGRIFSSARMSFAYGFLLISLLTTQEWRRSVRGLSLMAAVPSAKSYGPLHACSSWVIWAGVGLLANVPLYYTRNIERLAWAFVRIGYLPFLNTLLRYFILNQDGRLDNPDSFWITPISEAGVVLGLIAFLHGGGSSCLPIGSPSALQKPNST